MDSIARSCAVGVLLALLAATDVLAQLNDEIPHASYYAAKEALYSGEYQDAERALRRERGIRTGQTNWIDAVCYHAMLGEVLFQQGRNAEALAQFDQACQVFLAYPNFLLQVKFQSTIGGIRPDANRARRVPPWGRSSRNFVFGQFQDTEQVLMGDLDAQRNYQQGGVVRMPMLWRVNVAEVIRATALAIRRRNELLGPLAPQDAISKQMSITLAGGNLAPANHWSGVWIDLLRGLAESGMGKLNEADALLSRSLVASGQYDHPLTSVALLEQGRIAMVRGDGRRAAQLFADAGFSSFYFDDWDVLTESALGGWLNYMAMGAAGVYPALDPIAAWSQTNRLQHVATKLRLAQAESLLWLNQLAAAAAIIDDVGRRMGEMRGGLSSIQQAYLQAVLLLLQGKIDQGGEALTRASAAQANSSIRNFQILRTNQMYDARAASARVVVDFYKALLADPSPADWLRSPLDAMAVLQTGQDAAFERWFVAALERKETVLALEVAERAKRRRYLAAQPFGGRLLALRAILETPVAELSQEAVLQRQNILAKFPEYQTLSDAGLKIRDQLAASPVFGTNAAETKSLGALFDAWDRNAVARQRGLMQLAARRLPSACEFPPLRTVAELQQSLGPDEALVEFYSAAGNLYGFLLTKTDSHMWQLPESRNLRTGLADFLKGIGNFGANKQLSPADLKDDAWRAASKGAFATLFGDTKLDISKTTGLIIVPDDVLWYLPFEVLTPGGANGDKLLADCLPISYGPTAALAVSRAQPIARPRHTGIVANDLKFGADEADRTALLHELEASFTGPLALTESLPEPANLITPLVDQLVVLDDLPTNGAVGEAPSLLPKTRSRKDSLGSWINLPFGGTEQIVLTGVATEAEQGLKASKRGAANVRPGGEIFQSLCNMMAGGARTILITRWRTGGRTNFDLVREFAKELPNAPAASAWQRACLLARESQLDSSREPRLQRVGESVDMPTADHPFFWAGYLLVDTGPRPEVVVERAPAADAAKDGAAKPDQPKPDDAAKPEEPAGDKLPPPDKPPAEEPKTTANGEAAEK